MPEVQRLLAEAPSPDRRESLIIEWTARPGDDLLAGASTRRERIRRMEEFYRENLDSLVRRLKANPSIEVQNLPATGNAILTGPVPVLRELVRPQGLLDLDRQIIVMPNVSFATAH